MADCHPNTSPAPSPYDNQPLQAIMQILNFISLFLGCLTIILLLLIKKKHLFKTMSFYFCTSTTMTHLGFLVGPLLGMETLQKRDSMWCTVQGSWLQFFVTASVCWFGWISIQLYTVMVLEQSQNKTRLLWQHISCWGLPLLLTIIDLAVPGMVFREFWCWVPPCDDGLWEWLFYGPVLVILFVVALLWIRSLVKVLQYTTKVETKAFMIQNFLGVFILFASYTFQGGHRLYLLVEPPMLLLEYIHVITISWMGTLCFFVFGITPHNMESLRSKCCVKKEKKIIQEQY